MPEYNNNSNLSCTSLAHLGWDSYFQNHFNLKNNARSIPARVVGVHKNSFLVHQGETEKLVTVSGKITHHKGSLFPVTGDWVLIDDSVIRDVLPRKNTLSRGASGARGKQDQTPVREQVIAANLDFVFIVSGTDRDFNIPRIERYLTLVYTCALKPVIVLTKADLHQAPEKFVQKVEAVAFGVPVHLISARDRQGLDTLASYLSKGITVTMIGSSGAGKSTLVNRLYGGTVQATNTVSDAVGKGKHTTTSRSLIRMPQGGMVIDNPGIREIGLRDDSDGLDTAFPEIEALAAACRFRDCTHTNEPGCRILQGLSDGKIRQERLNSYLKMKRELSYMADRQHKSADRIEKERWKGISQKIRSIKKRK